MEQKVREELFSFLFPPHDVNSGREEAVKRGTGIHGQKSEKRLARFIPHATWRLSRLLSVSLKMRDNDDPEKTNTAYLEEPHPTHGKRGADKERAGEQIERRGEGEITIRVDEADRLSMASSHHQETERFLSTGTMGRRVSFNEAALFDHGKKAQEKGRRYTLTEGDFHHLKNARLTHLHIPAPGLKIVTIHECDAAENSVAMMTRPVAKSTLSIFQVTAP
ncbi:Voltage-dependent calcium channel beta subunit-associated regulatory protein [Liparis tanakae]|uniref:Voltage-dependent calcium channel beta subunit-associated regulatory protein n=1 Tax=Liparis tanakae TaxID=230148 RepID=A0A4Z2G3Q1_9TELE|nr:Voltage-dependent calcium channel beta subunit-associated regulatory protein [Liparis tanakae]